MPTVTFETSSDSPFISYVLDLAARFCGVGLAPVEPSALVHRVDVYYGNDETRPCILRIPRVAGYSLQGIPSVPSDDDEAMAEKSQAPFPFDLFAAIRFWLADEGNASLPGEAYDSHNRLCADRSSMELCGVREVPLVNAYLLLFRHWLEVRFKVRGTGILPAGKRCMVVLSHDVDSPVSYGDPGHRLWMAFKSIRQGRFRFTLSHLYGGFVQTLRWLKRPGQKWWLFREIMEAEERYDFRSSFFFAPTSRFITGASPLDVEYDISAPRFRRIFSEILERGWEIGLHIGYNSCRSSEVIRSEKDALEEAVGQEILGCRHHYWHMKRPFWPTLEDHAKAGLRYDSSIAFNESPGYRLSIAFPFYPWNPLSGGVIGTLQIPVIVMDDAFFCRGGQTVEATLNHFERLLNQLKMFEGVAAIDWHVRTSYPGSFMCRDYGEAYMAIVDMLGADDDVCVQSCAEVYRRCVDMKSAY